MRKLAGHGMHACNPTIQKAEKGRKTESESSLGYTARSCLENQKINKVKQNKMRKQENTPNVRHKVYFLSCPGEKQQQEMETDCPTVEETIRTPNVHKKKGSLWQSRWRKLY
jgi:hypothetical protein